MLQIEDFGAGYRFVDDKPDFYVDIIFPSQPIIYRNGVRVDSLDALSEGTLENNELAIYQVEI